MRTSHYLYIMANKLIDEQSPYLLQHAHNPVAWYPWSDEAFELAERSNKPLIVSIGYSACHWCHVMEKESFENEEVAAYMNEHFVCIKVDREEHPDVDHMYMDAVQAISGNGGWPLNVFVTPERAPFYGGTYYPPRPAFGRPSWMQLLERMSNIWNEQQDEVALQSGQMIEHLKNASLRVSKATAEGNGESICKQVADTLLKQADIEKGGFGSAPKFPGTMAISYLLEHYHYTGNEAALKHALHSLDSMIEGGICDQLAGGFSRYATDRNWLIPHFEKMLYDNALILSSLCDAYRITRDEKYRMVIEDTIAFAEEELREKSGGYYSALDADSEGEEGKYYTWTWEEWIAVAGEDNKVAAAYFGVTEEGNWEGTNILHISRPIDEVASFYSITVEAAREQVAGIKSKLYKARQKRIRPLTDDKSLLSWNALMNTALSKAAAALGHDKYKQRATEHMDWMCAHFRKNGVWLHAWKNGIAKIAANLDDYAYLAQAMLQLATVSGNNNWILEAGKLVEIVVEEFSHEEAFFYYTSSTQKDLPVRKVDIYDGATPSANAVMAGNLWLCGICLERNEWVEKARNMVQDMSGMATRYAYSFGYWALLLQRQYAGLKTVICSGINAHTAAANMGEYYNPEVFIVTLEKEISELPLLEKKFFDGKLYIFVCTEQACLSPVSSVGEAIGLINKYEEN